VNERCGAWNAALLIGALGMFVGGVITAVALAVWAFWE